MTCELNSSPCDQCELEHCPDQIEALQSKHTWLKGAVAVAKTKLHHAEKELALFVSVNQTYLEEK